eukprot:1184082-Prorocentrum_minimum.AAC.1
MYVFPYLSECFVLPHTEVDKMWTDVEELAVLMEEQKEGMEEQEHPPMPEEEEGPIPPVPPILEEEEQEAPTKSADPSMKKGLNFGKTGKDKMAAEPGPGTPAQEQETGTAVPAVGVQREQDDVSMTSPIRSGIRFEAPSSPFGGAEEPPSSPPPVPRERRGAEPEPATPNAEPATPLEGVWRALGRGLETPSEGGEGEGTPAGSSRRRSMRIKLQSPPGANAPWWMGSPGSTPVSAAEASRAEARKGAEAEEAPEGTPRVRKEHPPPPPAFSEGSVKKPRVAVVIEKVITLNYQQVRQKGRRSGGS